MESVTSTHFLPQLDFLTPDFLISDLLLIGDRGTNLLDGGAPFYET